MEDPQTIVVYHLDDEETPYRSKLKKSSDEITLIDFKSLIVNLPKTYKFFFKSEDADFGVVKEEISDDKSKLPILNGRIEAWLVSVDSSSAHSDTTTARSSRDQRPVAAGPAGGVAGSRLAGPASNSAIPLFTHERAKKVLQKVDTLLQGGQSTLPPSPVESIASQNRPLTPTPIVVPFNEYYTDLFLPSANFFVVGAGQKPTNYRLAGAGQAPLVDRFGRNARRAFDDESACTSDTESTVAGLPRISRFDHRFDRRSCRQNYYNKARPTSHPRNLNGRGANGPVLHSELENTSFFDSEDDQTKASFSTDITSVSRQYLKRRKKKRRFIRDLASKVSEVSSVTESSASLNIITVTLNIEPSGFLGISIAGTSDCPNGDGGIYVSDIMKGGAVALDGRIEKGDMILQVNDIPFHSMSNDNAVRILQRVVKEPGRPVKLAVAKSFDSRQPFPSSFTDYRQHEPVRPIDPGAWVAHTTALLASGNGGPSARAPSSALLPSTATAFVTPRGAEFALDVNGPSAAALKRPSSSAATLSSNNSGSYTGQMTSASAQMRTLEDREVKLDKNCHDMQTIVKFVARPDSGLEIKTRTWLKIDIPDAFMGSNLVDWLFAHVDGFSDRKDVKKYASQMLKDGYIKHTVNKFTFTEQCYYVFSNVCIEFAGMRLGGPRDDCSATFSDPPDVAPILPPVPGSLAQAPTPTWHQPYGSDSSAAVLNPHGLPPLNTANLVPSYEAANIPSIVTKSVPVPSLANITSMDGSTTVPSTGTVNVPSRGISSNAIMPPAQPIGTRNSPAYRPGAVNGQSSMVLPPPSYDWATSSVPKQRGGGGGVGGFPTEGDVAAASSVSGGSGATSSGCSVTVDRSKPSATTK